ncbi:MAG: hypothetical protein JTT12_05430 [Candidatus Brockarchaeota archaeon]|nr:hypothetical protein [Candidatus Brockarchaeota archaeon]
MEEQKRIEFKTGEEKKREIEERRNLSKLVKLKKEMEEKFAKRDFLNASIVLEDLLKEIERKKSEFGREIPDLVYSVEAEARMYAEALERYQKEGEKK